MCIRDSEYGLRCGGLQPVEDKMQWDILAEIVEKQRESGVDIRMISAEEACALEPQLSRDIYGEMCIRDRFALALSRLPRAKFP